jgi:hypothetical protein
MDPTDKEVLLQVCFDELLTAVVTSSREKFGTREAKEAHEWRECPWSSAEKRLLLAPRIEGRTYSIE